MLEQIKQVGKTYLTQRQLWWVLVVAGLVIVPNLLMAMLGTHSNTDRTANGALFTCAMPMLFLLPILVGQAKWQFAHWRARLMPGFLPAHLLVLIAILFLVFAVYPFCMAWAAGVEPLGLLALTAAVGVPTIWSAHSNRFGPILISLAAFYSLLTPWGINWWIVQAGEHRGLLAIVYGAGVALIVTWIVRLSNMHEEADDYQNLYSLMLARRTGTDSSEARRILASQVRRNRLMSLVGDWWHARIGGYFGGSPAGRARLLRYGFSTSPIEIQGLFFAAMIVTIGIFFTQFTFMAKGGGFGGIFFLAGFAVLLPGQIGGEMMAQRRPRMASELLLPLSRTQLLDGLFAASIGNSVRLWLIINSALAVVGVTLKDEISVHTVAMFLLMSASVTFTAFGLSMRTAVWPSMVKRLVVLWFGWMALISPLVSWATMHERWGETPFLLCALVLVLIGTGLLYWARLTWQKLEFV
jgi:hypothetical protein